MKFRSNKTSPQPVRQNFQATPPTPPTSANKAKLDPVFLDLIGNIKEKKVNKMRISN
jgi:hypothetical protein